MLENEIFSVKPLRESGKVLIELSEKPEHDLEVEFINSSGRTVLQKKVRKENYRENIFFTFLPGYYLVQLRMNGEVYFSRLIVD
jgi:hypothetical protein